MIFPPTMASARAAARNMPTLRQVARFADMNNVPRQDVTRGRIQDGIGDGVADMRLLAYIARVQVSSRAAGPIGQPTRTLGGFCGLASVR